MFSQPLCIKGPAQMGSGVLKYWSMFSVVAPDDLALF